MIRTISCIGILGLLCVTSLFSQATGEAEDFSATATNWLLDAVGDSGRTAVSSIYMIYSPRTNSKGSGFKLQGGPIITNEHVIRGCNPTDITVTSSTGKRLQVQGVEFDTTRDLAALFIGKDFDDGLRLGSDDTLSVGEILWTWGFPLGYNGPAPILSVGYLSGFKSRIGKGGDNEKIKHIIVNAAFNSGNSGGPVFRANGNKVIGVVVNKALPLFTPAVSSAIDALASQNSGMMYQAVDASGVSSEISEAQIVAQIVKSLRDMSQVMIGEAVSVSELRAFLASHKIEYLR